MTGKSNQQIIDLAVLMLRLDAGEKDSASVATFEREFDSLTNGESLAAYLAYRLMKGHAFSIMSDGNIGGLDSRCYDIARELGAWS
jgi:hypothetical protein